MKHLAIDPGTTKSAFVVWDGQNICDCGIVPNAEMLNRVADGYNFKIAIERIESYGMSVGREVFETVYWSGRMIDRALLWRSWGVALIPRREVKLHLCGTVRAKDSNIIQALKDIHGDKGTKKNPGKTFPLKADMWQAFALACTAFDVPRLMEEYKVI